jgi:hypothetical protein
MQRFVIIGVGLLLAAAVAACGVGGGSSGGGGAPLSTSDVATLANSRSATAPTSRVTRGNPTADGSDDVGDVLTDAQIAEFKEDLKGAIDSVNGYWAYNWWQGYTYQPPRVWYYDTDLPGLYSSITRDEPSAPEWAEGPRCDGARALAENAFYCGDGSDTLAWDALFMARAFELGDSYLYLIIYHEWGHAVQYRFVHQIGRPELVAVQSELQADCLAGSAVAGAVADRYLILDPGVEQEFVTSLSNIASVGPWATQGDHGSALERVQAYTAGYQQGPQACFPGQGTVF